MRSFTITYTGHFTPGLGAFIRAMILAGTLPTMAWAQTQTCITGITPSTPDAYFIDNQDGTVTDTSTGLMWMQCSLGQSGSDCSQGTATEYNWQAALQAADATYAEHSDWRLPNVKELLSLVEISCHNPSINVSVFPNTPSSSWSSSAGTGVVAAAYKSSGSFDYASSGSFNYDSSGSSSFDYAWYVHFDDGSYGGSRNTARHVRLVRDD